jgi:hypothetical protein
LWPGDFIRIRAFEIESVPNAEIDPNAVFESIGPSFFALAFDLERKSAWILMEEGNGNPEGVSTLVPGLSFSEGSPFSWEWGNFVVETPYRKPDAEGTPLKHVVESCSSGLLCVAFVPANHKEIEAAKGVINNVLNRRTVRESSSAGGLLGGRSTTTSQRDIFSGSEEFLMFNSILSSLDNALLTNSLAFRTYFVFSDSDEVKRALSTRFLILGYKKFGSPLQSVFSELKSIYQLPGGVDYCKQFLSFPGIHELKYQVRTVTPRSESSGVLLGTYFRDGVSQTQQEIRIRPSTMNLGCMMTGLPGSGKTRGAMAILESLKEEETGAKVVVISPTEEWNDFGRSHGMYVVSMYDCKTPINFFRCPDGANRLKFYEDLAMLLSSASDAGPYRNPMEKCMLNAFRNIYEKSGEPGPAEVYERIEDSIIKFHAKVTSTGVKYTKHGENIKSALENLRGIIHRREYSCAKGIRIEELLKNGVVFDLSGVSTKIKPYIYALLLNQIYAAIGSFDTNGDDLLRVLVCVEESQIIFGSRDAPAVQDIKQRIQDFRKKGVGLLILAHNASDIDPGIRRLCQVKLYMKQAPDVAELASRDMVFTHTEDDEVVLKLKHLDSRIGALSYVLKVGGDKLAQDTIFVRTTDYAESAVPSGTDISKYMEENRISVPAELECMIEIVFEPQADKASRRAVEVYSGRITYLGDVVDEFDVSIVEGRFSTFCGLVMRRDYKLDLFSQTGRKVFKLGFVAEAEVKIVLK